MSRYRKMLTDRDAPYIHTLMELIETQSKDTIAHWVISQAESVMLPLWKKYHPDDMRPQDALMAARKWLMGVVKLPQAKAAILECHAAAREANEDPVAQAAARAIGHCASTIHSVRHCIGLVLYGALAVSYDKLGVDAAWESIEKCAVEECSRMEAALRTAAVDNEPDLVNIEWK